MSDLLAYVCHMWNDIIYASNPRKFGRINDCHGKPHHVTIATLPQSQSTTLPRTYSTDMFTDAILAAGTGATFGAALTASRVHLPSVIISQMQLTDFRMAQVFASAMGTSA